MKKAIINYLRRYFFIFKEVYQAGPFLLLISLISVVFSGCHHIITAFLLKKIVAAIENFYSTGELVSYNYFLIIISCNLVLFTLRSIVHNASFLINRITGLTLSHNIQNMLVNKIKKVKYDVFYSSQFQNNYTNILSNSNSEPLQIIISMFAILTLLCDFFGSSFVILNYNHWLVLFLVLCFVPSMVVNLKNQNSYIDTWKKQAENSRKMTYYFNIMTDNIYQKETRQFSLHDYFVNKKKEIFDISIKKWKTLEKNTFFKNIKSDILSCFGLSISIFLLLLRTLQKRHSIADFMFYSEIILALKDICINLVEEFAKSHKGLLFIGQFLDFLSEENEIETKGIPLNDNSIHTLEFKNVFFKYPNTKNYVLKNINLTINSGEKVFLVGKNGSGKSTVLNLILRLYEPTRGKIILDGTDIKYYKIEDYRKKISAIFQDCQKYAMNIADYIAAGDISKELKDDITVLHKAVKLAQLEEVIEKSEKKYESNLTKIFDLNGLELSGGQWQRLALARVFFAKAFILVFDEPTSAVDAAAELEIYSNIQRIDSEKIVLIVSHQIYACRNADKIIFIKDGIISSVGKHAELIEKDHEYKLLFEKQLKNMLMNKKV